MTKVYLVFLQTSYEDCGVEGVFKDEKSAQEYILQEEEYWRRYYWVEEFEVK